MRQVRRRLPALHCVFRLKGLGSGALGLGFRVEALGLFRGLGFDGLGRRGWVNIGLERQELHLFKSSTQTTTVPAARNNKVGLGFRRYRVQEV